MILNVEGRAVLAFDTGLDSRAFAQAKFAQCVTEPGCIVRFDSAGNAAVEAWTASGVIEHSGEPGGRQTMAVWGPLFEGRRLDVLLADETKRAEALAAVILWARAL